MIKVLFVCLGNICRSPLAEAIFNEKIKKLALEDKILSDSVGTANYHVGKDPDPRSIEVAVNHNIPISHKGRQLNLPDGKTFDYILAMDASNYRNIIHSLGYRHEGLFLMRDYDSLGVGEDVPDPYYGGKEGFENMYQMLDRSINHFIEFVKENHAL